MIFSAPRSAIDWSYTYMHYDAHAQLTTHVRCKLLLPAAPCEIEAENG